MDTLTLGISTRSDRELMRLAAKAAGITDYSAGRDANGAMLLCRNGSEFYTWRPLQDDGDTLRLAVKLGMEVSCDGEEKIIVGWPDPHHEASRDGCTFYSHVAEPKGTDPYAATRRAVVSAAATIGEKQ